MLQKRAVQNKKRTKNVGEGQVETALLLAAQAGASPKRRYAHLSGCRGVHAASFVWQHVAAGAAVLPGAQAACTHQRASKGVSR